MRKSLVTVISLLSLMILIIIQVYIIVSYYKAKSRIFDMTYSRALLSTIENNAVDYPAEALDMAMNRTAASFLLNIPDTLDNSFRLKVLAKFDSLLNRYDENSPKVKRYLYDNKLDTIFNSKYSINAISFLISDNKIPVYVNPEFKNGRQISKGIYIKSYYKEGDFYAVQYDYFVDLTHKSKLILSEMKGLLLLVFLTITAVTIAFVYTLVTLQRQKKLSELKDDFIDNITHDFKTPLSVIAVAVATLKQKKIRDDDQKFIETCNALEKQNRFLSGMIDSVIDVSLLERESVIINRKPVILQSFMDEIVVSFKGNCEAAGKNVLILAEYTIPDNYKHSLDQAQFTRAISNLLANSVKYCEREPLISIRVLLNHVLQIVIEDNGIGIKEEHQINVFNKFYRAGNPANVKGLGLGLYIVKRIVENHDGTIRIDSEWGKGTTVTITLPK